MLNSVLVISKHVVNVKLSNFREKENMEIVVISIAISVD